MKFRFKLNAVTIFLLVAVILLCGYGIALNIIALSENLETLKIILNVILVLVNLALIVTVFSIALFSKNILKYSAECAIIHSFLNKPTQRSKNHE